MLSSQAPDDVCALWLRVLQRAMGRASHDVKDALNGVSVNLEVIRSRAARPDAPAAAVAVFGEAAGQQLERLTTLLEAILALTRAEREPADVAVTLRRLGSLCGASASMADASIAVINEGGAGSTTTRVHGEAVRLALGATMLDAVAGADRGIPASLVTCTLRSDDADVLVDIVADGRRIALGDGVADVARAAGIRWLDGASGVTLAFPRA